MKIATKNFTNSSSIASHNSNFSDLVSVIIPTWNRWVLLSRAIASVRYQTHQNWELIIVNDASSDDTVPNVMELCANDSRIKLVNNPIQHGGGYCRHLGTQHATGDYIAFLDSDDYWLSNKLQKQISAARNSGFKDLVMLSPMAIEIDNRLLRVKQAQLLANQNICDYLYNRHGASLQSSCFMVSGDLARRITFDPTLQVNQDTDYLLKLEHAGAKFIYLDEALHVQDVKPRADRISMNTNLIDQSLAWFNHNPYAWSNASRKGFYLSDTAIRYARSGNRTQALRYFFLGLSASTGIFYAIRQLIRVLYGGELPRSFSRIWKTIRIVTDTKNTPLLTVIQFVLFLTAVLTDTQA
jgi:glycosyltransferase involved in cell wall biosynthesis